MGETKQQRSATIGDPTSLSCISHPLEFTEIDLGPIAESASHPLANEGTLIEVETPQQSAETTDDHSENADTWDRPPPDLNGPSSDAAPPAYDEALTCGTECPPQALPRHPFQDDFDFDMEDNRRSAEMRLELSLIKANRKKMYINFFLGILFLLIVLVIFRFTFINFDDPAPTHPPPASSTTTVESASMTEDPN
ncbi:hypothetical protein PENTCL1PPCAC_29748 [Pristionchus entomophagus]|uniref:Uncharacterized protein n=1 Tax=Pristionchus entomophagus TaxID=358040 RepID=A0AAV5UMJ8_9BILA|nr:hypothetical protein PENTCL1PPCAC_29748 [Pristionchus entomophagus]